MDRALLVEFLLEAIDAASPDPPGNEEAIASVITKWLERLGIAYEKEAIGAGRYNILAKISASKNAESVLLENTKMDNRGSLIFSAHMDTLPSGSEGWLGSPFCARVEDGKIIGRGACDMKSGLVAMVGAMALFQNLHKHSKGDLKGDLLLALTCGETSTCIGARHFVEKGVLGKAKALLVAEPTSLAPVVATMGALWLKVSIKGVLGHVSGGNHRNAIMDMVSWLQAVGELCEGVNEHPLLGRPKALPGTIKGGEAVNFSPDNCEVLLDYRFLPCQNPQEIVARARALSSTIPGIEANNVEVTVIDIKSAVETSPDNDFVLMSQEIVTRHLGRKKAVRGVSYFSDGAIYVPAYDLPMVMIGPGELGGSGAVNEWCSIDNVEKAQKIFFDIARTYLL